MIKDYMKLQITFPNKVDTYLGKRFIMYSDTVRFSDKLDAAIKKYELALYNEKGLKEAYVRIGNGSYMSITYIYDENDRIIAIDKTGRNPIDAIHTDIIYDKDGREISRTKKDANGKIIILGSYDYSNDNKLIHYTSSSGYEYWLTLDESGLLPISFRDSNKLSYIKKYNDEGLLVYYEDCNNYNCTIAYGENNKDEYVKDSNGFEIWKKYDKDNKLISYKDSEGFYRDIKYDEYGNDIYIKEPNKECVKTYKCL